MDNLEEKIRYHKLYDLYGSLLTAKQKDYFEYYHLEDYSLSEIAKIMGVSRNAVHDQLKIVLEHLDNYEHHLHLFEKAKVQRRLVQSILEKSNDPDVLALARELEKAE